MNDPEAPSSADGWTSLSRQLLPGARVAHAEALSGGVSAQTTALTLEAENGARRRVVVRRYDAASGRHDPAADLAREHALLRALHGAGLPVPEPLLLDAEGRGLGSPCLVTTFVERRGGGPPLPARVLRMAEQLASIHEVPTALLPALPERLDPLPELYAWLPAGPPSLSVRAALSALGDTRWRGPAALLHGDFWPANLLWDGDRVAAVLDWEDAALGDPHSDVAGARLELTLAHDEAAAEAFTLRYAERRPLAAERLSLWDVYVAAAMLSFLSEWGLPSERERILRSGAEAFLAGAMRRVVQRHDERAPTPSGERHGALPGPGADPSS